MQFKTGRLKWDLRETRRLGLPTAGDAVYGDFATILRTNTKWQVGRVKLRDGSYWEYREPSAVLDVRRGNLRVCVNPFTRFHDTIQTLDNAKHLYFSQEDVTVPQDCEATFELSMAAKGIRTDSGDIYDGFVTFHLLEVRAGIASDFFAGDKTIAVAYSYPRPPQANQGSRGGLKYLAQFHEASIPTAPGQIHRYAITYNRNANELVWKVDDEVVRKESSVPSKMQTFKLGLGLMTAKNISQGGSISVHGQGVLGEWSPIRISCLRSS